MLNSRPKAMVVETSTGGTPVRIRRNASGLGTSSVTGLTMRAGTKPPSCFRCFNRYWISGLSGGGW